MYLQVFREQDEQKKLCINVNHKQSGLDFIAFCSFLKGMKYDIA